MTWQEKLTRIQNLAMERDQIVHEFLGGTWKGGRLVLGRYYAQSDKIYLGLNPGYWKGVTNYPFCVDPAEAPLNSPFRIPFGEISVEHRAVQVPDGRYSVTYEAEDKKSGLFCHVVWFGQTWLGADDRCS